MTNSNIKIKGPLELHTKVKWTNRGVDHSGTIVAVVPANSHFLTSNIEASRRTGCTALQTPGSQRDHESYVVHVPTVSGKGKGRLYWPNVKRLDADDE